MNEETNTSSNTEDVLDTLHGLLSEESEGRPVYLNDGLFLDIEGNLTESPYNRV